MVKFGGIELDPIEIGINGNAVLGIKESGKSYLATELGEMLFDAGIPFIAFDPIGIWHNMKIPGQGRGYPVVVAGGVAGDIPLTVETAPAIVEAAMKKGVSLVIDLFHVDLSKADWHRIVRDCCNLLLHRNKDHGLRHVFIEEAAEFVPQRPMDGLTYAAVEKLIRMGGNSRLGCTLISPRSQEVNKAVLELCENMFLFRQRGKNALENMKKWLDVAGAAATDVMRTLPNLPTGDCWAWLAGSDVPVLLHVPPKNSFHPNRRATHGDVAKPKKPVAVGKFVDALKDELPKLEADKKAADPVALRGEIARLERELATAQRGKGPAYPDLRQEVAALRARLRSLTTKARRVRDEMDRAQKRMEDMVSSGAATRESLHEAIVEAVDAGGVDSKGPEEIGKTRGSGGAIGTPGVAVAMANMGRPVVAVPAAEIRQVPSGCNKPLAVLAGVYPGGMTEGQWSTAAGYKKGGGTWKEYRSRLKRAEMIELRDGMYFATAVGAASAGDVELPPPPGPALARWWAGKISGTPKMVEALIEAWPDRVTRQELAATLAMSADGGTFKEYLSRLARNGIIHRNDDGIMLSADVMGDA